MDDRMIVQTLAVEALKEMGDVPYWKKEGMVAIDKMPNWMARNLGVRRQL